VAQCLRDKIQECDANSSAILVATPSLCGPDGPAAGVIEVHLNSRSEVLQSIARLEGPSAITQAPGGWVHGWLSSIAVGSQHRRQGCAAALLRESEQLISLWGCAWGALRVDHHNTAALRLYKKCGWQAAPVQQQASWLPWCQETVLMVKHLAL
jgi:ribosomal protein S18 acetylase RimI-like enzyme